MIRSRCVRLLAAAYLMVVVGIGCRGSSTHGVTLVSWASSCAQDMDCVSGRCICGACSLSCDGSAESCASAPPGASCHAAGSFAFAALCTEAEAPGLCLIACSPGDACEEGLECRAGACVPEGAAYPPAPDAAAPESAPVLSPSEDCIAPVGAPMSYACACRSAPDEGCRSIDEALAQTGNCWLVSTGCAMVLLQRNAGYVSYQYWYDAADGTPVGVSIGTDAPPGAEGADRNLDCPEMTPTCSTCGAGLPNCSELPGVLPTAP